MLAGRGSDVLLAIDDVKPLATEEMLRSSSMAMGICSASRS